MPHAKERLDMNTCANFHINLTIGIRRRAASRLYFCKWCDSGRQIEKPFLIEGILVDKIQNLLLVQFANDIDIYLLFNQKALDSVLETLECFKLSSGFTVNYDKTQIYEPILQKVDMMLNNWAPRRLSPVGKVNVINTSITSSFVHKIFVLAMVTELLTVIESHMENRN